MANIVIAGANRGIGLALVKAYLDGGNRVFALCRDPENAQQLKQLAANADNLLSLHPVDMADGASIDKVAEAVGGKPVNVLLNVAGILGGKTDTVLDSTFTDEDFAQWRQAFEVMITGPFRLTQALLPNLIEAGGKVMTVSSKIASSTWHEGGVYAYAAAKAGVNRMMRSLAIDLKDKGVAVAVIHPGHVQTDMGGPSAEITAEESAAGIKAVVENLTLADAGEFFQWDGEKHEW